MSQSPKHLFGKYLAGVVFATLLIGLATFSSFVSLADSRVPLFSPDVADCNGGSSLKTARQYPTGNSPMAVAVSDFNQDSLLDLAVSDSTGITTLLGNGQGAFVYGANIPTNSLSESIATGDFNRDGKQDLAVTGANAEIIEGVDILLGAGDGSFFKANSYATGNIVFSIVTADFNGDSALDLAVANQSSQTTSILLGRGNGAFNQAVNYSIGSPVVGVVAADFNGDGKIDLATASRTGGYPIMLLWGNGAGGFTPMTYTNLLSDCYSIATGDFNDDGKPDLIVSQNAGTRILLNNGAGGFGEPINAGQVSTSIATGDFNSDGKSDLALANFNGYIDGVSTFLGNGSGGFNRVAVYGAGRVVRALAVGDFTQDGKPDLVAANRETDNISILLGAGNGEFQAAIIAQVGISPVAIVAGDLNKDGKPDLMAPNASIGISVALANDSKSFGAQKRYDMIGFPTATAAVGGDFNNDGVADLAITTADVSYLNRDGVTLWLGDGRGGLTGGGGAFTGARPVAIIAADFNSDGNPDVATANANANNVSVMLGQGIRGLSEARHFPAGSEPRSLSAGDFNSDGKTDLAVVTPNNLSLRLLWGDGNGGFTGADLGLDANPKLAAAGDFNGDGKTDLAVAYNNTSQISILLSSGAGNFLAPVNTNVEKDPFEIVVADITSDGKLDLAFTRAFGNQDYRDDRVTVWAGDGRGGFNLAADFIVPLGTHLTTADFNNDGKPDLAIVTAGSSGASRVWIALSDCDLAPPPIVTNVSAASYRSVTIAREAITSAFGVGLSAETASATTLPLPTQLAGTRVVVRDYAGVSRLAPLFFVSPTQINYQMTPGIRLGPATVTVAGANGKISTGTALIVATAPGLFAANADGQGVAAAVALRVRQDGAQVYEPVARFDSAQNKFVAIPIDLSDASEQVFLLLFGTGLRNNSGLANVNVKIGGERVGASFAGAQGGFAGLDQVNLRLLPFLRGRGDVTVELMVDGKAANTVMINIK